MKYKYIIIVFFLGFLSCKDNLNLIPSTSKTSGNFFSNEQEIESAIIGVYATLQSNALYGLDLIGVGDIPGEDSFEEISGNDGARFGDLDDFTTNSQNDLVGDIWRVSYQAIQRTNTVLNRISSVTFKDSSIKNYRIGEMQFVRALLYLNLVRLYGDVPLVTNETTDVFDYVGKGRNPQNDIYVQIEKDLKEAINNLPLDKTSGRPAKGAAQATLGDAYLTRGDYANALTQFKAIVDSGKYNVLATNKIFGVENEGNSEILFEIQFVSGLNNNSEGSRAGSQFRPSGTTASAKGHNLPTATFFSLYENNDTRKTDYISRDTSESNFYFSNKYEVSATGANDGGSDHIIIRYSDVVLKYAECLNETGNTTNAITELNKIRTRSGLTGTTATGLSGVRTAIRLERRLELINEGHRWYDLKRYGTAVSVLTKYFSDNSITATINENKLLLPIPQSQIDTDPAIKQNPGY